MNVKKEKMNDKILFFSQSQMDFNKNLIQNLIIKDKEYIKNWINVR